VLGLVHRTIGALAAEHRQRNEAGELSGDRGEGSTEGREWVGQGGRGWGCAAPTRELARMGWVQRTLELIDSIDAVQPRFSGSGGWT
jgi:hypothetical protein